VGGAQVVLSGKEVTDKTCYSLLFNRKVLKMSSTVSTALGEHLHTRTFATILFKSVQQFRFHCAEVDNGA